LKEPERATIPRARLDGSRARRLFWLSSAVFVVVVVVFSQISKALRLV